jgi:hypothetical protein
MRFINGKIPPKKKKAALIYLRVCSFDEREGETHKRPRAAFCYSLSFFPFPSKLFFLYVLYFICQTSKQKRTSPARFLYITPKGPFYSTTASGSEVAVLALHSAVVDAAFLFIFQLFFFLAGVIAREHRSFVVCFPFRAWFARDSFFFSSCALRALCVRMCVLFAVAIVTAVVSLPSPFFDSSSF